ETIDGRQHALEPEQRREVGRFGPQRREIDGRRLIVLAGALELEALADRLGRQGASAQEHDGRDDQQGEAPRTHGDWGGGAFSLRKYSSTNRRCSGVRPWSSSHLGYRSRGPAPVAPGFRMSGMCTLSPVAERLTRSLFSSGSSFESVRPASSSRRYSRCWRSIVCWSRRPASS